jgi:hypothetical protein
LNPYHQHQHNMPGFIPDMRLMRGENFDILEDEHALAITFRGRVVYRTESPIIIRAALLTGQAGHRIYDMLHRANRLIDQDTHDTSQEENQEEPQPQPQPSTPQPAPTVTILDQTKRINRLILRFTLACIYVTILVLRQIVLLVALAARVSGTTLDAPRPRAGRGRQRQKQQQQQEGQRQRRPRSGSDDEAYQRSLRIANSAREFRAAIDAVSALVGPVQLSMPREDGQSEDETQPGLAAFRVDRRASVEEVPDMEGAGGQGLTTGTDQAGRTDAGQRRLTAGRKQGGMTDDDDDDDC